MTTRTRLIIVIIQQIGEGLLGEALLSLLRTSLLQIKISFMPHLIE